MNTGERNSFLDQLRRCSHLRVVVPSRTPSARVLPLRHWTNVFVARVLPLSGGATEIAALGHWLDKRRRHITEPVRIVEVYLHRHLKLLDARHLAHDFMSFAAQMEQEALAVVVQYRLFLLKPPAGLAIDRDTASRQRFLRLAATKGGTVAGGGVLKTG